MKSLLGDHFSVRKVQFDGAALLQYIYTCTLMRRNASVETFRLITLDKERKLRTSCMYLTSSRQPCESLHLVFISFESLVVGCWVLDVRQRSYGWCTGRMTPTRRDLGSQKKVRKVASVFSSRIAVTCGRKTREYAVKQHRTLPVVVRYPLAFHS